tara:strand:+ start:612 stop:1511 length:900 start_codon:yes stop_codon:yes gene_type:complete
LQFDKDEIIIYTVLIGSNEGLNRQPQIKYSKYRHVCLTDNKNLTSKDWEIVQINRILPQDSYRSQRHLKLRAHITFPSYKYSLYFDNTIVFKVKIEDFIKGILKDKIIKDNEPFFIAPYHSYRRDLLSEFKVCSQYNLDNNQRIYEQLNDYIKTKKEILKQKPYLGGILLRNHNHEEIINHSEIWFSHICKYTRRDQLSLLHSAYQANIKIDGFDLNIKKSIYHNWPVELKKRNRQLKDIEFDLISNKFSQKIEKLIFQLELEKERTNKLVPRLKLIKIIIFNLKSYLKYVLRKIINVL